MKPTNKWSNQKVRDVAACIRNGHTREQTSYITGVPVNTIKMWLRKGGRVITMLENWDESQKASDSGDRTLPGFEGLQGEENSSSAEHVESAGEG